VTNNSFPELSECLFTLNAREDIEIEYNHFKNIPLKGKLGSEKFVMWSQNK